jgi:hypothetical protein
MEDEDPQRWGRRYKGNKLAGKKEEIEDEKKEHDGAVIAEALLSCSINLADMIADAKISYSHNFLMEILITGCWSIWEQRNDAISRGIYPDVQRCVARFKSFISLNLYRAKPSLKEGMQSWLDTL